MESTRSSSKGQMVIPKPVREALGIRSGTELDVELLPGKAFKVSVRSTDHAAQVRRLAGSLSRYAKGRGSARSDDAAILRVVARDDARIRSYAARKRR
ncbi:MAG: AbrB/MazE/SpoVT family DNA-binding domain-containing protein [Pseudomonadota bacterium]